MSSSEENAMNDRITIEGRDGAFGAYISRPKTVPAPGVVVLHEVFGVNADIRKTCDRRKRVIDTAMTRCDSLALPASQERA